MKNKKILLTGMALLPTLSLCSCQVSNYQKNNIKEVSKKYSLSDGQIINSKYSSLDAVRSMSDDTDVTQDQLNHRIAAIEDKTQYTLYAVGLDKTTVDTTIGLMEKNISNKITEELASNNLPADGQLTQDSLNNVYSYVNSQAAEFGVDVIDYDRFQYDIPTMAAKYEIDLINAGVDKDVAIEQATQYKSDILDTLDAANESLYDDVTYSLLLNEFQTNENLTLNYLKNNKINVDEKQKNDKDAELETVLT
ncbi:MAG: hypothetical protein K2L48_03070 [Mycoplasmoidaceae bacterium]|nr:hypothetical protein [Mycoplasmoidaceae bacterium]